jgi:hypothetical protein
MIVRKRASSRKAAYERAMREAWDTATEKHDPLVTDEQRARRQALARQNRKLIDQLRARFNSEQVD